MVKLPKNFRLWGLILFLTLLFIIFIPALMEYHSTKQDLVQLWQDQSRLVAETIVRSSQSLLRYDQQVFFEKRQQLLNDALILRQLDSLNFPRLQPLLEFNRHRFHGKILFFDLNGRLLWPQQLKTLKRSQKLLAKMKQKLQNFPADSVVQLFVPKPNKRPGLPMLVIRRSQERGFIVVLLHPTAGTLLTQFRGLKRWLDEVVQAPNILYIEIWKGAQLIVHAGDVLPERPAKRSLTQPFQTRWAILTVGAQTIFDYWQPAPGGFSLHIGLITEALNHLQKNLIQRLILNSILLFILAFLIFRFALNKQNMAFLQNRIQQLETYTTAILRNMSDGVLAINTNRQIEFNNSAFSALTGISEVNQLKTALQFLPTELRQKVERFEAIDQFPLNYNHRFLLVSGKSIQLVNSAESKQQIYLLIVRDFTVQKELDEIRSRRSRLLAMGELASRVAHEIRNPLNGIAMLAQRLQKEFKPSENGNEFQQMTAAIRQETERLNQIVQSFLLYARNPQLNLKTTPMGAFLQELKTILQAAGPCPLRIEILKETRVKLDRDQFKQALLNLVKNAMEASPPDKPVRIILDTQDQQARLQIEDQGKGLDQDIKERIFDLYFTTKEQGTGIGLSIVEKIVEAHGGLINVESPYPKEGQMVQGTRFTILLPLTNERD